MQNTIHMAVDLPGPQAGAMNHLGFATRRPPCCFCALRCFITWWLL